MAFNCVNLKVFTGIIGCVELILFLSINYLKINSNYIILNRTKVPMAMLKVLRLSKSATNLMFGV